VNVIFPRFDDLTFEVVTIAGEEAISELFAFHVSVVVARDSHPFHSGNAPLERALLREEVRFRVAPNAIERFGIVREARNEGLHTIGDRAFDRVRLEIVPRAWLLTLKRNTRIFQNKHVFEIVSAVLHEAGIRHRFQLARGYVQRTYCTQYEETDWELVTRLFAEEGISFYFEHRERFRGSSEPAKRRIKPSEHDENLATAKEVIGLLGSMGKETSTQLKSANVDDQGVMGLANSAFSLAGSAADAFESAADKAPHVPGEGSFGADGDGEVLFFVDQEHGWIRSTRGDHAPLEVSVVADTEESTDDATLVELFPTREDASEHVEIRDYDFEKPLLLLRRHARFRDDQFVHAEIVDDPTAGGTSNDVQLERYDHHGEHIDPDVTDVAAKLHLEQHRRRTVRATGRGRCPHFVSGHNFELLPAARDASIAPGRYVATRVRHEYTETQRVPGAEASDALIAALARAVHEATQAGAALTEETIRQVARRGYEQPRPITYQAFLTCVPDSFPIRPARPPRVMRTVTETATVTGGKDKDIVLDKYGRIKVQFHWDRDGKFDDKSSCWLRVAQPWAGAGFGFQFFPRVGMEVLVTFLGGDPDRPIVIGSVYNGTHATPEALPEHLTRSAIRTQSSPGGGGFNELAFEDKKGLERVFIRAERDLEALVRKEVTIRVEERVRAILGGDSDTAVGGRHTLAVAQDRTATVGGVSAETIGRDAVRRVAGSESVTIEGNRNEEVRGVETKQVLGSQLTSVHGVLDQSVFGDAFVQVRPPAGEGEDAGGSAVLFVDGLAAFTATKSIVLRTDSNGPDTRSLRFECGDSVIELLPDKITMTSKTVHVTGTDGVMLRGKDATLALDGAGAKLSGDPVHIATPAGATLRVAGAESEVNGPGGTRVRGSTVAIATGEGAAAAASAGSPPPEELVPLDVTFTHQWPNDGGQPIADVRCSVVAGTFQEEKTTNGRGQLTIDVPKDAKVLQVTVFAYEKYADLYPPERGPLRWTVHLVDALGGEATPKGLRMRLRNLGYEASMELETAFVRERATDQATQRAIVNYQIDTAQPVTGKADRATADAVRGTYGR
jgi:type VI secretion system secreted protein VgrG